MTTWTKTTIAGADIYSTDLFGGALTLAKTAAGAWQANFKLVHPDAKEGEAGEIESTIPLHDLDQDNITQVQAVAEERLIHTLNTNGYKFHIPPEEPTQPAPQQTVAATAPTAVASVIKE